MFDKVKNALKKYWLPLFVSCLVGFISVLPQILAIHALGDAYQGIHFLYIDDEDNYMAIIRDVVNGHWLAGSPEFFEYKQSKPIMLPFGAYFYALPIMILNIPIVWVMLVAKFIFPALLFGLVFALSKKLSLGSNHVRTLNGIFAGLFVTLGFELVDYGTVWKFLSGHVDYPIFSLWTRPVNPITGAILLFTFILIVLNYFETGKKYLLFVAGAIQAIMVSYFFSWGVSLAISGTLFVLFLVRKEYDHAKSIVASMGIGLLLLLPYWIIAWNSLGAGFGNETAARNGMFFTHVPIFNKVILAGWLVFLPSFIFEWWRGRSAKRPLEQWWWYCLVFLGASSVALNQQIITGRTIWPYHFVQYTVALTMVSVLVFLCNYLRPKFPKIWTAAAMGVSSIILAYGIAISFTYHYRMTDFKELQRYQPLFTWVNSTAPKDCVILPMPNAERTINLINAFTHCNTYVSGQNFIIPKERVMHNFVTWMRLQNINPNQAREYLYVNPNIISSNFYPDWHQLFKPDIQAAWFTKAVDEVVVEYSQFYQRDFGTELSKYRLDYVVTEGDLDPTITKAVPGLRFVTKLDKMQVYEFVPEK